MTWGIKNRVAKKGRRRGVGGRSKGITEHYYCYTTIEWGEKVSGCGFFLEESEDESSEEREKGEGRGTEGGGR